MVYEPLAGRDVHVDQALPDALAGDLGRDPGRLPLLNYCAPAQVGAGPGHGRAGHDGADVRGRGAAQGDARAERRRGALEGG